MISIIVPVYNVEFFLERCINSVIKQTLSEWEMILVNDGSTDNSGKICREYSLRDQRIKTIEISNSGVSVARNIGLKQAKGSLILFIDSDDWIEKNTLHEISDILINESPELIIFGIRTFYKKNKTSKTTYQNKTYSLNNFLDIFLAINIGDGVVNKVFRRDIIEKNKINFKKGVHMGEDALFVLDYLEKINIITTSDKILYNYERRGNSSATKKFFLDLDESLFNIQTSKINFLIKHNKYSENNKILISDRALDWYLLCLSNFIINISNKKILIKTIMKMKTTIFSLIDVNLYKQSKNKKYIDLFAKGNFEKLINYWRWNHIWLFYKSLTIKIIKKVSFLNFFYLMYNKNRVK